MVGGAGRDRLLRPGPQIDGQDSLSPVHPESDRPAGDVEQAPSAFGKAVRAEQRCRQRPPIPRTGPAHDGEPVGKLGAIAPGAVDLDAEVTGAALLVQDPWADLEGRPVADMDSVMARQLRHPVALLIGPEADDGADHR